MPNEETEAGSEGQVCAVDVGEEFPEYVQRVYRMAFAFVIDHVLTLEEAAQEESGRGKDVMNTAADFYRQRLSAADRRFACVRDRALAAKIVGQLADPEAAWAETRLPEERGDLANSVIGQLHITRENYDQINHRLKKRGIRLDPWGAR